MLRDIEHLQLKHAANSGAYKLVFGKRWIAFPGRGCRYTPELGGLQLLQGDDATLTQLYLERNKIGDDGVGILVDALQNNKSLTTLNLLENDDISTEGQIKLLKLVNDISARAEFYSS